MVEKLETRKILDELKGFFVLDLSMESQVF
jgi:hypothetical protein